MNNASEYLEEDTECKLCLGQENNYITLAKNRIRTDPNLACHVCHQYSLLTNIHYGIINVEKSLK